ncbi:hypothetical protein BRC82_10240 [Halobacteriales archaeon QS_1_67_19]|nr:MAG: hypothetical protein BRC82_10240 [Halobacteriales archaeon QS_1_67_19]
MDEDEFRHRLDRIERRQYLILGVLAVPYFVVARYIGVWTAGVACAAFGVALFGLIAYRRRGRSDGTR